MVKKTKKTTALAGALLLLIIFLTMYGAARQIVRVGADYPQTLIAEDLIHTLEGGGQLPVPTYTTDLEKDHGTFFMIYDATGKVLASSAALRGIPPAIPQGVLQKASSSGRTTLTWQPQGGVRLATIVMPLSISSSTGYVAVGRSLDDADALTHSLLLLILIAWIVAEVIWCGYWYLRE